MVSPSSLTQICRKKYCHLFFRKKWRKVIIRWKEVSSQRPVSTIASHPRNKLVKFGSYRSWRLYCDTSFLAIKYTLPYKKMISEYYVCAVEGIRILNKIRGESSLRDSLQVSRALWMYMDLPIRMTRLYKRNLTVGKWRGWSAKCHP